MYQLIVNLIQKCKFEQIVTWLFFITIFAALSYLTYEQTIANGFTNSDIRIHITYAINLLEKPSNLFIFLEPGFALLTIILVKICSLSFNIAATIVVAMFYTAFVFVLFKIIKKELKLDNFLTLGICLIAILVVPIFIPFVSKTFYLLFGSPNVWHNNTVLLIKVFSLYITYITMSKIVKAKYDGWFYFLAASLFVSSLFKPSYAEVFIPALFIYSFFSSYKSGNFKQLRYAVLLAIPTIVLLGWQFWAWKFSAYSFYNIVCPEFPKSFIIFTFFDVIQYYTHSPFNGSGPLVGFLRANAFPLVVLMFVNKRVSRELCFSWIMLVIAYLQFAFLAEATDKGMLVSGNFTWGYIISLQLVFIFSIIDFIKWLILSRNINIRYLTLKVSTISVLLFWHFVSGVVYFYRVSSGGSFW